MEWDDYFMNLAYFFAMKSKDNRTHIGAVVVSPKREIRSSGYNGFVRGSNDNDPRRQEKGEKQYWFEHAERNAIYNATLIGTSLDGCIMYTPGIPCMDCARGIVQSGIREVIIDSNWETNKPEKIGKNRRTLKLFKEVRVKLREHDTTYFQITKMNDSVVSLLTED